jgi:catechol 2,3-dioxygenase-like lactoylglutathione lyase family enzyme
VPRVARFNSLEPRLHIADFKTSVAFYRDLLGFEVLSTFPEDEPSFALLARDGVGLQIGGIDTAKPPGSLPTVTLYFDVTDALGLHERLKSRVKIEWGPEVHFYHRREFAFRDPDGHLVVISEETDDPVTAVED